MFGMDGAQDDRVDLAPFPALQDTQTSTMLGYRHVARHLLNSCAGAEPKMADDAEDDIGTEAIGVQVQPAIQA
jgi:hypothetical protein